MRANPNQGAAMKHLFFLFFWFLMICFTLMIQPETHEVFGELVFYVKILMILLDLIFPVLYIVYLFGRNRHVQETLLIGSGVVVVVYLFILFLNI